MHVLLLWGVFVGDDRLMVFQSADEADMAARWAGIKDYVVRGVAVFR